MMRVILVIAFFFAKLLIPNRFFDKINKKIKNESENQKKIEILFIL